MINELLLCMQKSSCMFTIPTDNTIVSRIYTPRFATLALVKSKGGEGAYIALFPGLHAQLLLLASLVLQKLEYLLVKID